MNGKLKVVPKNKFGILSTVNVKETSISETSVHYESESRGLDSQCDGLHVCHYKLK